MEDMLSREVSYYHNDREEIKELLRTQQESYADNMKQSLGELIKNDLKGEPSVECNTEKESFRCRLRKFKERLNNLLLS